MVRVVTLISRPVDVVVTMTVCSSIIVLTNDVSCVFVNVLTGDESSEMLPTSGLLRSGCGVSPDTQ